MADHRPIGAGPAAASAKPKRREDIVTLLGRSAPFAIIAYCLALAAFRLSFSPYLEVDEAEFVGRVDFRLIYDNAHPPLFNWLTRVALELTAWSWADALAIVKFGLLAAFHFFTWNCATRLGGPRAGALALAASAFLPQIVWMSAVTLAHSVMVLAGAGALLYATLRALKNPSWRAYLWLGLAMSLGALAKFNFFLLLIPFFAAFALDREGRALFRGPGAWAAPAAFLAVSGPSLVAALLYPQDSGARIEKLYRASDFAWVDLPYLGIDGFLALIVSGLAWAAPAAAIWAAARWWDRRRGAAAAPATTPSGSAGLSAETVARILERAMLGGLALFALIILAGDMSRIEERYLTPILALSPVYLALRWPLGPSAKPVALLGGAAYLAVFAGYWGMATYGEHRFGIPFDAVAAQIRRQSPEPAPILARRHDDQANLVLALGWPGAETPRYQPVEDRVVIVWRGRGAAPDVLAPAGFGPAAAIATVVAPYRNASGATAVYSFQRFERITPQ